MKTNILKTGSFLVLAVVFSSFTNTLLNKEVKVKESTINWKGYKVAGSHEGTINLKEGELTFNNDVLSGGNFTIDMASINVTDLETGDGKENLEGHLKSDDFFGVENYPQAKLEITKVKEKNGNFQVTGDLTIKGQTHPINFNMSIANKTATANLKIDRTKYDIKYGSSSFFDGLKDKAIYDEFDLNVILKF